MFSRIVGSLVLLISTQVFALDLELTQGINSALPIAINSFGDDEGGVEIGTIIEHDMNFSGQFRVVSGHQYERPVDVLKRMGADSVVRGKVTRSGGRYEVSFELVDAVAQGKVLATKSWQVGGHQLRDLAHHISDIVYQKLTGERGIFSTKIAYILVQKTSGGSRFSLEVADVDGYNPQSLLVSSEPIMSPSWSPDGHQIAYVSFEKKRSQIYTVNVGTGQRRLITSFPGINGAPAWSPDGRHLAVVLSKSGDAKIYTVDLSNGSMKQLTFGDSIDTEPRYSSDGQSLLFTSGRGGSPQIYKMNLANGQISRMTFDGSYNARASLTPDGRNLVIVHRTEDRQFNIGVQSASGSAVNVLTSAYIDESPSVAPNGKLILYETKQNEKGVLGIVSVDGRIKMRLPSRDGDVQEPAWSPFLG